MATGEPAMTDRWDKMAASLRANQEEGARVVAEIREEGLARFVGHRATYYGLVLVTRFAMGVSEGFDAWDALEEDPPR